MRNNTRSNNTRSNARVKPVQARYTRAVATMRGLHVSMETKALQKEIEWIRHEIESYGFEFFPNHYVFEKVREFEEKVSELVNHKSTKSNK